MDAPLTGQVVMGDHVLTGMMERMNTAIRNDVLVKDLFTNSQCIELLVREIEEEVAVDQDDMLKQRQDSAVFSMQLVTRQAKGESTKRGEEVMRLNSHGRIAVRMKLRGCILVNRIQRVVEEDVQLVG